MGKVGSMKSPEFVIFYRLNRFNLNTRPIHSKTQLIHLNTRSIHPIFTDSLVDIVSCIRLGAVRLEVETNRSSRIELGGVFKP